MAKAEAEPKYPEVAAFMSDLMVRLGARNTDELADKLGWATSSRIRYLHKIVRGDHRPNMLKTLELLRAARMLADEPGDPVEAQLAEAAARLLATAGEAEVELARIRQGRKRHGNS